jgi:aminobenzoyl-glutamate utilization protein B
MRNPLVTEKPFDMKHFFLLVICAVMSWSTLAQSKKAVERMKERASQNILGDRAEYEALALKIWELAEVGYKEERSAVLMQEKLRSQGFRITTGVAGIPTAFVAEYGSGSPAIGILAEYDALPGLSQMAVTERKPIDGLGAGHACGHHLFGTASVAAAIAIKDLIDQGSIKGTVKLFGCPAEEGGSGKVYMVRAGLFEGLDAVIHWHPGDRNEVTLTSALANKSAKFRFYGAAAHASSAPDKGRSALDGVEAMNFMTNLMREHMPQEARMHYIITRGGTAPNVVPDFAEVYYYVRHPDKNVVKELFARVEAAATGAAMGTGTKTDYEIIGGTHDLLINKTLARVAQTNLEKVGGVKYTEEEIAFAKKIQETLMSPRDLSRASTIIPFDAERTEGIASTDVGDVSYAVPTVGVRIATWVPGTPAHSWQAVACGGTSIGLKGMFVAAQTMALTAIDLYTQPQLLLDAKNEHTAAMGDYKYEALLGDREPALDYRD